MSTVPGPPGAPRHLDAPTLVTPEAVPLSLPTAGIGSRAVALLLDGLLMAAGVVVVVVGASLLGGVLGGLLPGTPDYLGVVLVLLLVFGLWFGYPVLFETLWRGRTPGKAAMGLRVVTVEGGPIRFRHAAIRGVLGLVDFWLTSGAAAVLAALVSARQQRLGDMVAGTLVVRERVATTAPQVAHFSVPPGAEAYAATLDTSGLRPQDYQAVRSFLLRAGTLAPQVRTDLARQIAEPLAARMHHVPPPGVTPELFLACVAARVQQARPPAPGGWPGRSPGGSPGGAPGGWPGGPPLAGDWRR